MTSDEAMKFANDGDAMSLKLRQLARDASLPEKTRTAARRLHKALDKMVSDVEAFSQLGLPLGD